MRFSSSILAAVSFAALASAVPWASADADAFALEARDAYPFADPFAEASFGIYTREAAAEAEAEAAKAKEKNVNIALDKVSKNFKQKDEQNAKADACDALNKAGCTHGTITHAWHTSNGESEEHMSIKPTGGDNMDRGQIHLYRDGKVTQGPNGKHVYKRRARAAANAYVKSVLAAKSAYAEAMNY